MDISNEIKYMTIQCLNTLLDIWPQHTNTMVSLGIIAKMNEVMNETVGFMELAEACITVYEKISHESSGALLRADVAINCLNIFYFFDKTTQNKII